MARVLGAAAAPRRRRHEPPVWTFLALRIRRYEPDDNATVFALHQECLAQVGLRPGDGVYYDDDFARVEESYLRAGGEFVVGEVRGEIAAIGGLRRVNDLVVEMVRLRVRPDQQGQGYGAAVVAVLEERAMELGFRVLRADTTVKQPVAMELYRSSGWRETNRKVTGATVTVYFEKRLAR
ncbi:MAG: GNAT family N-acetyltransferase [Actinoallomurus sp.]